MTHRSPDIPLTINALRVAYARGSVTPVGVAGALASRLEAIGSDPAWISVANRATLYERAAEIEARGRAAGGDLSTLPLYGIPFAVKDNIDVADEVTTAACPAFAYIARADATVVERLRNAGALLVGKTNLDQFATGLVGTRSPYGEVPNTFDERYISGGSSSGSASVVARGLVAFALGTDTAGSGRVPAACNNLVGLKPTRGSISTRGVVPACRSLDCVSIFTHTVGDALDVLDACSAYDPGDPYSRADLPRRPAPAAIKRLGIPAVIDWHGDAAQHRAWQRALGLLAASGVDIVTLDFSVLDAVAVELYAGAWVAERYAVAGELIARDPAAVDVTVRRVIEGGRDVTGVDVFRAQYRLAERKRTADALLASVDALCVPTAPCFWTRAEVRADPIATNAALGAFTNFVNLLDWSALAVPAPFRDDRLPFGITLIGNTGQERSLARFAEQWHSALGLPLGATQVPHPGTHSERAERGTAHVRVAVVGAHLSGMPLNHELTSRGARLVGATHTAPLYRLFALPGTTPPKPGLVRVPGNGAALAVEVWEMPVERYGDFVSGVPAPLAIGTLDLAHGVRVQGFVCEAYAVAGAADISDYGGWREYITAGAPAAAA
jgi:allophanate hydrolase